MNIRTISLSLAMTVALSASVASAAPIIATSYTFDQATDSGSFVYNDTGAELIDGIVGDAGWATHSGVEWDGWLDALINIDFTFAGPQTFHTISVGSTQDNPTDVVLPNINVFSSLNGLVWTPRASVITPISNANDNYAYSTAPHTWLTASGMDFTAPYVRVQIVRNNAFSFVDEVRFDGVAGSAAVPEPMSWALMLTGFFGLGSMVRRRRAAAA